MGTRSGDIDPAVLFQLHRRHEMSIDDLDHLLNKKSGLLGMTGKADMRDVLAGRAAGEEISTLAFDVYVHRLRAYVGSRTTRERQARGEGITVWEVGPAGELTRQQVLGDLVNPSYLTLNARGALSATHTLPVRTGSWLVDTLGEDDTPACALNALNQCDMNRQDWVTVLRYQSNS